MATFELVSKKLAQRIFKICIEHVFDADDLFVKINK